MYICQRISLNVYLLCIYAHMRMIYYCDSTRIRQLLYQHYIRNIYLKISSNLKCSPQKQRIYCSYSEGNLLFIIELYHHSRTFTKHCCLNRPSFVATVTLVYPVSIPFTTPFFTVATSLLSVVHVRSDSLYPLGKECSLIPAF